MINVGKLNNRPIIWITDYQPDCRLSSGYVLRGPQVVGPTFSKSAGWYMKKRFEKCLNYFLWC
jgi:hypothetical protein